MPIKKLTSEIIFPPVENADEQGIVAFGGDLSPARLIEAYKSGIFPWFSEGDPIIWWSPDPRFVLFPEELKISKSMRQVLNRNIFEIRLDTDFVSVIEGCRNPRKRQRGTWITDEMKNAYIELHTMGYAHSAESWINGRLAGGLYGIAIGKCFFGESMFTLEPNASKAAFITLVKRLYSLGFLIIDCQVYTNHLESLGAEEISRDDFIAIIKEGLSHESITGSWTGLL